MTIKIISFIFRSYRILSRVGKNVSFVETLRLNSVPRLVTTIGKAVAYVACDGRVITKNNKLYDRPIVVNFHNTI